MSSTYEPIKLATLELFDQTQQPACYICGEGNSRDTLHCGLCGAPTALSQNDDPTRPKPHRVAALGGPGVGKTVYLGMLMDMLSRQQGSMQISVRGALSVRLQQAVMTELAAGRFPPPTELNPREWNWVHCEVRRSRLSRPVEVILPDLAGRSFVDEIENPHGCNSICHFLRPCMAAMVLVDASQLEQHDQDQDFWAMKILAFLHELDHSKKTGWHKRHIAVVFTKCDKSESCFEDPAGFARARVPGLWRVCQDQLPKHRFFATSVVGAAAQFTRYGFTTSVPLRVEPRGVVEPFSWLVERLPKR